MYLVCISCTDHKHRLNIFCKTITNACIALVFVCCTLKFLKTVPHFCKCVLYLKRTQLIPLEFQLISEESNECIIINLKNEMTANIFLSQRVRI